MPRVLATHAVGNLETWLSGGDERAAIFAQFCTGYRVFRQPEANRIAIVWEDADLEKLEAVLGAPETEEAKVRHTVLEPIEIYVEVDGQR